MTVPFEVTPFRPGLIKSFYLNPDGSRTDSGISFEPGEIMLVVEVRGEDVPNDPAALIYKIRRVNTEGIVGYVWVQVRQNDWFEKTGTLRNSFVPLLEPVDENLYMTKLVVCRWDGLNVYPIRANTQPAIEKVPAGTILWEKNEPDGYPEVCWTSINGDYHDEGYVVEKTYVSPNRYTAGMYYAALVELIRPAAQVDDPPVITPPVVVPGEEDPTPGAVSTSAEDVIEAAANLVRALFNYRRQP